MVVKAEEAQAEERLAPEEIIERINHTGAMATRKVIVEVIDRLPRDVQEMALECVYVSVGRATLGAAYRFSSNHRVVFLSDDVTRLRPHDAHSIAAHEIAHQWCRHPDDYDSSDFSRMVEMEVEACSLAREWGFDGHGTRVASYIAYLLRQGDIFDPNDLISPEADKLTRWETGWAVEHWRRWDALVSTFNEEQRELYESVKEAEKQAQACAQSSRSSDVEPIPPPGAEEEGTDHG